MGSGNGQSGPYRIHLRNEDQMMSQVYEWGHTALGRLGKRLGDGGLIEVAAHVQMGRWKGGSPTRSPSLALSARGEPQPRPTRRKMTSYTQLTD
jgi:hypothetical protein